MEDKLKRHFFQIMPGQQDNTHNIKTTHADNLKDGRVTPALHPQPSPWPTKRTQEISPTDVIFNKTIIPCTRS